MRKEEKSIIIENIATTVKSYTHFYLTNTAGLNAEKTTALRRACNAGEIKLLVVKNTMLRKALESLDVDFSPLFGSLKGATTVMCTNSANAPAKLIKNFRKGNETLPAFKAAYAEESFYIGADQLDALVAIKSKNELLGEVIGLLQSPASNVISALQSGGGTIHGVLETLSKR